MFKNDFIVMPNMPIEPIMPIEPEMPNEPVMCIMPIAPVMPFTPRRSTRANLGKKVIRYGSPVDWKNVRLRR